MTAPGLPPRITALLDQVRAQPAPARAPTPVPVPDSVLHGSLSGAQWGDLEIGDLIGSGGMGEVYRARQGGTGRLVALKVMHPQTIASDDLRRRFAGEARAAALVRSAHVVGVYASGEHDGRPWLALEYVDGTTLDQALRQRLAAGQRFSPREVVDLIGQAALGLAAAHDERLVHRDLKPANLLLAGDGTLKIADFGLVRFLDQRLTRTGTVLGTPRYIAPEQGRGLETDARSDIYSLGVVMYELLTSRPPFDGETAEALIFQHNFAEPVLPGQLNPDVPLDVQAVCLKCLQKDPAQRYADADDLARDLQRLHGGLAPLSAIFGPGELNTGASQALRRLAGWRRRWWAVTGIVAATALVIAAAAWWWDGRKTELTALRTRLAPVAQTATVPATAGADATRLAALAGDGDPQVVQARSKLTRMAELAADLERLTTAPADRPTQDAVRATLAAVTELVGPAGDPRQQRWTAWLAAAEARCELLRSRLAARLAQAEFLDHRLRQLVDADLQAFLVLAGPADADRVAWTDLVRRSAEAAAAARTALTALDRPQPPPAEAGAWLDRYRQLAGDDDPQVQAWRARLAAYQAGQARLLEHARAAGQRANAWVLPADALASARAGLADWRQLAGDDPMVIAATARLDALCGPPAPAWAARRGHDQHGPWLDLAVGGATQRLRWLPPGTFTMGSPPDEAARDADEVQVRVRLGRGLWVADRECTQALWLAVMGTRPSEHRGDDLPVEQVSAADAEAFCTRLGGQLPGCTARLPSEAEWEALVRAGDPGAWPGLDPRQVAAAVVHAGSDGPAAVGDRPANALGIHDGLGNLWEWCATGYGPHPAGDPVVDPFPTPGKQRVARGGSWGDPLTACRAANRVGLDPAAASPYLGFRFVVLP